MNPIAQLTPQEIARSYDNYLGARDPNWIWYAVAALVAVFVVLLLWQITSIAKARRGPRLLFYEIADLHGIPRSAQQRLLHLARTHRVPDPACLFVCPELLGRIESIEIGHARRDRERARLEDFFLNFRNAAFGRSVDRTATPTP